MQCASFTAIPMSPLVYTRLQMIFSLQHGLWPTQLKCVRFDFCQYSLIRKGRFLNDKPLNRSNLILQRWNQWRNSKLYGFRSSSQVRLATSEIFWNLRLLTARGRENILLDKFLLLIRIDIFHTKQELTVPNDIVNTWIKTTAMSTNQNHYQLFGISHYTAEGNSQ